jgi:integrase
MTMHGQPETRRRAQASGRRGQHQVQRVEAWIGRLMVGHRLDGKPDVREVSANSQRVCRERLDALKGQAANGTLPSGETAGMSVSAFLDRWLTTVKPKLRPKTYRMYSQFVEIHYKPALGSKRLTKLSHDDVQGFLNAKRDEKRRRGKSERLLAPRTVHHLYVVLGTALNWAVKKGYIAFSPMLRVDPPPVPSTEMTPPTAQQTARLLDVAAAEADPLLALWTLAALTGARKGELLGLTWDDIDLEAGALRIRPSAIRDLKTARSRRTLDLDDDAVAALAAHRDRQAFARQALGEAYDDQNLVFASEIGTPLDPDNVSKRFKRALKVAGLPPTTRLHDLRHGVATLLLEAGETVPTVSEYLGHASPAVTMAIYAHAVPGAKKRAARKLGAIIREARKRPENTAEESSVAG